MKTTIALATFFAAYWLIALRLDVKTDIRTQTVIGLTTWLFLVVVLRLSPWTERMQVLTMIAVATFFECLCSLLLGLYSYRLDNLPVYVPPGHGLFYLMALRIADLPSLRRHTRSIVWLVFAGGTVLMLHGLLSGPVPDLFGLVTWVIFLSFMLRERFALLYAVSFTMTMALEFYGTNLGIWTWAAVMPLLRLPASNPPACIGAGYCIMDGITRCVAPRMQKLWRRCKRTLVPVSHESQLTN